MQRVGYTRWGYIAVDSEPKDNQVTSWNPPMLTNLALDDGASLTVDLSPGLSSTIISIKTTAFSSPTDPDSSFKLFYGKQEHSFNEIDSTSWETLNEGNFVINKSKIESEVLLSLIKIFYKGPTTIVTNIEFEIIDTQCFQK